MSWTRVPSEASWLGADGQAGGQSPMFCTYFIFQEVERVLYLREDRPCGRLGKRGRKREVK
jgi:hypothetical protein